MTIEILTYSGSAILVAGIILYFVDFNINNYIGYRTKRSMSSIDSWKYANKLFGKLLLLSDVIYLLVGWNIKNMPFFTVTSLLILFVTLGLSIFYTEYQLAQRFDREKLQKK